MATSLSLSAFAPLAQDSKSYRTASRTSSLVSKRATTASFSCRGRSPQLPSSSFLPLSSKFHPSLPARRQSSQQRKLSVSAGAGPESQWQASAPPAESFLPEEDPVEAARIAQASKRVEQTSRYFRRLGVVGFWLQLGCSLVAAVILAFSIVITGRPTAPVTTYLTSAGIVAGFLSVFWAFGYLRLSDRLRNAVSNPAKAPPRAVVVANLKNGLIINLLGMAATLVGLQATVGTLVAKALTSSTPIYGAVGLPSGYNPVLALDVFLVQASANAALSHFVGLLLALELLRSVTGSQPPPEKVIPVAA